MDSDKEFINEIISELATQSGTAIDKDDPVIIAALILKKSIDRSLSNNDKNNNNINIDNTLPDKINQAMMQYVEKADNQFTKLDDLVSKSNINKTSQKSEYINILIISILILQFITILLLVI